VIARAHRPHPYRQITTCAGDIQLIDKHLRRRAVEEITGLGRSTIYDLMARGQFPRPVKLSTKTVAWPESVIAAWLADRAEATKGEAA
jgi:prophage regulatory protein